MSKKHFVHIISVKGGNTMTNNCCNSCVQTTSCNAGGGMTNYAFILVLFILLVICGAAFMF